MSPDPKDTRHFDERVHDEMVETVDEELEMEIDDARLASLLEQERGIARRPGR